MGKGADGHKGTLEDGGKVALVSTSVALQERTRTQAQHAALYMSHTPETGLYTHELGQEQG